jgi:hypothetical protein
LIGYDNDTVSELNQRARTHLVASNRLGGSTLEVGGRVFQTGDRILCRKNQSRLGVLNGDLGTVVSANHNHGSLTVRLDRDPEIRDLPVWYLQQGHVEHGYALTGHKAQGVTTGRTFILVNGNTDRQWAYVAMSRGRQANTLYVAGPEPEDHECIHLARPDRRDALELLTASLARSSTQTAAIDQYFESSSRGDIDTLASAPPSSDVAERVAWIVAQRRAEPNQLERSTHGIDVAASH